MGLRNLCDAGIVQAYPPLCDIKARPAQSPFAPCDHPGTEMNMSVGIDVAGTNMW